MLRRCRAVWVAKGYPNQTLSCPQLITGNATKGFHPYYHADVLTHDLLLITRTVPPVRPDQVTIRTPPRMHLATAAGFQLMYGRVANPSFPVLAPMLRLYRMVAFAPNHLLSLSPSQIPLAKDSITLLHCAFGFWVRLPR